MTASIVRLDARVAYDLIYPEHLALLNEHDQGVMLRSMMSSSHIWIGRDDDKVLAIWGLVAPSILSDRAYLWMYHTEHLREHTFMFIRHSQIAMQEMLATYPHIIGHAVVGADHSIRWLRWLGAKFGAPEGQLLPFEIKAKHG